MVESLYEFVEEVLVEALQRNATKLFLKICWRGVKVSLDDDAEKPTTFKKLETASYLQLASRWFDVPYLQQAHVKEDIKTLSETDFAEHLEEILGAQPRASLYLEDCPYVVECRNKGVQCFNVSIECQQRMVRAPRFSTRIPSFECSEVIQSKEIFGRLELFSEKMKHLKHIFQHKGDVCSFIQGNGLRNWVYLNYRRINTEFLDEFVKKLHFIAAIHHISSWNLRGHFPIWFDKQAIIQSLCPHYVLHVTSESVHPEIRPDPHAREAHFVVKDFWLTDANLINQIKKEVYSSSEAGQNLETSFENVESANLKDILKELHKLLHIRYGDPKPKRKANCVELCSKDIREFSIVNQVDESLIMAYLPRINHLVAVDQHAASERVELEKLLDLGVEAISNYVVSLDLKLQLPYFSRIEEEHENQMTELGWRFGTVGTHPTFAQINIRRAPNVLGVKLPCSLFLSNLLWTFKPPGQKGEYPSEIYEIFKSKACQSAWKFGDHMSLDDQANLLTKLGETQLPFECAHGRPTVHVIY